MSGSGRGRRSTTSATISRICGTRPRSARAELEAGADRAALQSLLPPGGARNALDCALWDLEARIAGQPAWRLAGLDRFDTLPTTMTLGADQPSRMAEVAERPLRRLADAQAQADR